MTLIAAVVRPRSSVVAQVGHTALLVACAAGQIDVVRWLVTEGGSDARSERDKVR
jgi:ankyrin repeat protein